MNQQIFFCFGPPKSGTTFLQRALNLHPEISCPPEHQFDFLINNLGELLKQYDAILPILRERFKQRFGDVLVKLGYEKNNNW